MAVTKLNAEGFPLDADGKPIINSISRTTGKKLMPKSTGRTKGTGMKMGRPSSATPKVEVAALLTGKRGEHVKGVLSETQAMPDDELIRRGRAIAEEHMETLPNARDAGPILGMQRDELGALCYRLATRGLTLEQIATQMKLPYEVVKKITQRMSLALRLDPKTLDVGFYMGESLAFYAEIRQMALLAASAAGNSASLKLRALEVAMNAEDRKNAFLTKIGVYSPTVVERIESWVISTTDTMAAPPNNADRVNIAAEIGKALARRSLRGDESMPEDVQVRDSNG